MRYETPLTFADASGKLGNQIYSRNQYGRYIKAYASPVQPNTVWQRRAQTTLGDLSSLWSQLTEDQRQSWRSAVPLWQKQDMFSDVYRLQPKNLFVRLNYLIYFWKSNFNQFAPAPLPYGQIHLSSWVFSASQSQIDFEVFGLPALSAVYISSTPPLPANVNYFKNKLTRLNIRTSTNGVNFNDRSAFTRNYGPITAGMRAGFGFKAFNQTTGQSTPWLYSLLTATA